MKHDFDLNMLMLLTSVNRKICPYTQSRSILSLEYFIEIAISKYAHKNYQLEI